MLPDRDEMHGVLPSSLTAASNVKEVMSVFRKTYTIDGVTIHLRGTPQGDRTPMLIAKFPDGKLLGGTRVTAATTAEDVFDVMKAVLTEMEEGKVAFSKTAFYIRRAEFIENELRDAGES